MPEYAVVVHSYGVAKIEAPSKAAAGRRARAGDFDSYVLREPEAAISSLAEGEPVPHMLTPTAATRAVVYRKNP